MIPAFLCSSDPEQKLIFLGDESGGGNPASPNHDKQGAPLFKGSRSNYIGMFGTVEVEDFPDDGDGVFFHNKRIRFADITDGLSNTTSGGRAAGRSSALKLWQGVVPGAAEAAGAAGGRGGSSTERSAHSLR